MVLEKLITIRQALKHPLLMFIVGGVVSLVSLFLSFLIFPESIGLFTTILITFAMTPFMVNLMIHDEIMTEVEVKRRLQQSFWQRHIDTLVVYVSLFVGMIVALSVAFLTIPEPTVNSIFQDQIREIDLIRGSFLFSNTFAKIATNNIGVLFISVLFSFVFGSGAVFILSWNASVLSTAIGLTAKSFGGIEGIPVALATYMPHGIFEIIAYFLAGIAGGILSAGIMRKKSAFFNLVVIDSLKIIVVAVALLFIGATIETMILEA